MGGSSSKDDLISKLDDLDKEEIEINKELRELQIRLNELVPPEERIDVKEHYFDETISKRKKMGEPDYNIPINGKLITDKKHRVIFNPPRTINKSDINKALSSINREMDQAAEEFYQASKKNDYSL